MHRRIMLISFSRSEPSNVTSFFFHPVLLVSPLEASLSPSSTLFLLSPLSLESTLQGCFSLTLPLSQPPTPPIQQIER